MVRCISASLGDASPDFNATTYCPSTLAVERTPRGEETVGSNLTATGLLSVHLSLSIGGVSLNRDL